MGNVSVSGLAPWRGGSSECTDDSESWDCYLRNDPPCDASEITISTTSSRSTSTCTVARGVGFEAVRGSTRETKAGKRSKMNQSMGTSARKSIEPTHLMKAQEHLQDEIRQLRTELDSAKVLLSKQEGLEQRIVELERRTKQIQGGGFVSQVAAKEAAADHEKEGAPSSPVYAVATESL